MKTKKLIVGILIFIIVTIALAFINTAKAASLGKLSIVKERTENGITYKHQLYSREPAKTKNIWNIVQYIGGTASTGITTKEIDDVYCIKAGLGFTNENRTGIADYVEYDLSYTISKSNVEETYRQLVDLYKNTTDTASIFKPENSKNFYAMLWILDNMLLEDASEQQFQEYLKGGSTDREYKNKLGAGYTQEELDYKTTNDKLGTGQIKNVLTRADIEVIQQLAVWYLTNGNETEYNQETLKDMFLSTTGTESEDYLEQSGKEYGTYGDLYNITGKDIIQNGQIIFRGGTYGDQRQNHAMQLYSNLITKAKAAVEANGGTYTPKREITIYLAGGGNFADEQPVVQVKEYKGDADIALRKFISAINGEELENSREPEVDTSKFNSAIAGTSKIETTAEYNHPKKPVPVKVGDIVTYTIRLYNEGEIDTYIMEVKDYLPNYLTYVGNGGNNSDPSYSYWTWIFNESESYATTTANCKVVGAGGKLTEADIKNNDGTYKTLGEILIPAAEENKSVTGTANRYTLSYVDIQINCKVTNSGDDLVPYDKPITNIAEVTIMTDGNREPVSDRDSDTSNVKIPPTAEYPDLPTYKEDEEDKLYVPGQEDDDDFDKVVVEKPIIDLALRKFISKVGDKTYNRAPVVDTSDLKTGRKTTATYNHSKEPVEVNIGDVVTYTIRLYNEGELDGYVSEVTDYIAKNLVYEPNEEGAGKENWWSSKNGTNYDTLTTKSNCKVVGAGGKLTEADIKNSDGTYKTLDQVLIPAYDKANDKLSYIDIQVRCMVVETENLPIETTIKLTNIAEITEERDENNREVEKDKDSTPDNVVVPPSQKYPDLPIYKDDESNKPYVPGQEDDDDFEKVIVVVREVDLSLRKYISEVDGVAPAVSREPNVNTNVMDTYISTTAEYNHTKDPLKVRMGSLVTYTIRVYNEGDVDAYVSEITDYLPSYLTYVEDNEINKEYEWNYNGTTKQVKTTVTAKNNSKAKLLNKYDGNGELDYTEVKIVCRVADNAIGNGILTNLAQITEMTDETGKIIDKDRDSKPGENKKNGDKFWIPEGEDRPTYKDDESNKPYVPGQEDDDDFEKVFVIAPEMDLSLRKYISAVDGEKLTGDNSREPIVDTTPLDTGTDTTANYNHPKKPIMVNKGSKVTYTIRVYNEGELDSYVGEITDYLPNYLKYLPEDETNKKYGWTYNEETRQVITTITAKDNKDGDELYEDRENGKLLKAYNGNGTLDYIDVEIVCQIDDEAIGNGILTNLAQITEITDKNGEEVEEDRDSTPDGDFELPEDEDRPTYKDDEDDKPYVPGQEDDDDYEKVIVKGIFDLALRKFITQVENTPVNNRYPEVLYENGKISYKHPKDPVDVVTGDTVIYTIRIFNEGEVDGYANEITDDMPEGLEFLIDNEINKTYRWKMLDENQEETTDLSKAKYIVTDYLSEDQEEETGRDNKIKAFDKTSDIDNKNPDYRDVKVAFKVTYKATTTEESKRIIVNVAQISEDSDDDIDSEPNRDTPYDPDGPNEDDIDYDNVKVKYFDLSLLKWVAQTKVTLNGKEVITDTGHTAETSKNEAPVKIEIKEQDLKNIVIKYVYTIQITNEGEIEGYATEVKDYIPEGLKFIPEDNTEWRWNVSSDGIVTTDYLKDTLLKPGESATIPIVLTWINSAENIGEKINLAEISKDKNDSDSPDVDSTPDNKDPDEDDIDDAPVILAIKTGIEKFCIGITLIVLITFALGVQLIRKYVLE